MKMQTKWSLWIWIISISAIPHIHGQVAFQIQDQGPQECLSHPTEMTGSCVPINECPSMNKVFEQAKIGQADALTTLRRSLCSAGSSGRLNVCCPPEINSPSWSETGILERIADQLTQNLRNISGDPETNLFAVNPEFVAKHVCPNAEHVEVCTDIGTALAFTKKVRPLPLPDWLNENTVFSNAQDNIVYTLIPWAGVWVNTPKVKTWRCTTREGGPEGKEWNTCTFSGCCDGRSRASDGHFEGYYNPPCIPIPCPETK